MTQEIPGNAGPLEFARTLWSQLGLVVPGMVAPTVDTDELGKRIADLKAVEGWLKSNLQLLQMTIQGLEIQRATLLALQQMQASAQSGTAATETPPPPLFDPALWQWPWEMMKSALENGPSPTSAAAADAAAPAPKRRSRRKKGQSSEPQRQRQHPE